VERSRGESGDELRRQDDREWRGVAAAQSGGVIESEDESRSSLWQRESREVHFGLL